MEKSSTIQQVVAVKNAEDIQKLAFALPKLLPEISHGGSNRCVPVLTTGSTNQELVLVKNGESFMRYKVDESSTSSPELSNAGVAAIEKFLDEFDQKKHIVILYDDPKVCRSLEFRYLKTGLEKEQDQCIYVFAADDLETPESIRAQMEEYGIDTSRYLGDGSLKFISIEDPAKDPEGFLAGALKNVEKISAQITGPRVRVVAHQRYQFNTNDEIQGEYDAESEVESSFGSFPGSLLCNHYVGGSLSQRRGEWTKKMIETHDSVMVVAASSA